ncbi:hypothetical protein BH10BDE1_BH10BDE1_18630 [soil metagenome]
MSAQSCKREKWSQRCFGEFVAVAIFFATSLGLADARPDPCRDAYRQLLAELKANTGAPAKLRGFENENVRLIGRGEIGGHVYLVQPTGEAPFIVKVYDIGGAFVARNDRLALSVLDQALNSSPTPGSLKSVRVLEELDNRTLKLEHVAGRDVEDVGWKAGAQGTRLRRLLYRQLQEAKRRIEKIGSFSIDGAMYSVSQSTLRRGGELLMTLKNADPTAKPSSIRLILKSDGIALTSDGQFVVFDPS